MVPLYRIIYYNMFIRIFIKNTKCLLKSLKCNKHLIINNLEIVNKFSTSNSVNHISYIEKCKYIQFLKHHKDLCSTLLPKGKFLVYSGSRPFLQTLDEFDKSSITKLKWLTFPELQDYDVLSSVVLLDIDDNKNPLYGIQLGKLEANTMEEFEQRQGGTFYDLRAALFMVDGSSFQFLSKAYCLLMFHKKNKFCGNCGERMERNSAGWICRCMACKNILYPTSTPVGIVLVTDAENQSALLVRQPRHPPGMYSCIAGFSDVGENLEETVRREVAEEVGVEVCEIKYFASQHWPFPGSLMTGCFAVTIDTQLRIDRDELEDAKWFSREKIGNAIEIVEKDPFLMFEKSNDHFYIPRSGTIAHSLIKSWHQNKRFS